VLTFRFNYVGLSRPYWAGLRRQNGKKSEAWSPSSKRAGAGGGHLDVVEDGVHLDVVEDKVHLDVVEAIGHSI